MYRVFFIHLSTNRPLSCFCPLAVVNNTAVDVGMQISLEVPVFSSWSVYTCKGNCWIICSSISNFFRNHHTFFPWWSTLSHIPISSAQEFQFLHVPLFFFFPASTVVILMGVVLIYISQKISNIQHLFMCLFAICLSSLEKYSKFSARFLKLGSFNFCYWVEGVLYICCTLTPYWLQPWNEKMLAPWKKSYDQPRQHIKKQRHYFANKGPSSQGYGFFQ